MMHVSGQPPISTRPSFLPIAMFACLDHQPFSFPLRLSLCLWTSSCANVIRSNLTAASGRD
jgi:hypothetical protein